MDYYEELGIAASASEEEIRRAHRRLTKLLHPDQQTEESMKQLAETQMRRLNAIVETLCDPERRQQYDELLASDSLLPVPIVPRSGSAQATWRERIKWRSLPWWVGSTIGAIVLTVGAVWFWADNLGSSFGNLAPVSVSPQSEVSRTESTGSSSRSAPNKTREASGPERAANERAKTPPISSQAATPYKASAPIVITVPSPDVKPAAKNTPHAIPDGEGNNSKDLLHAARLVPAHITQSKVDIAPPPKLTANNAAPTEAPAIPLPALPAAVAAKVSAPAAAPKSGESGLASKGGNPTTNPLPLHREDPLEGEWVYAPRVPEKRKPGFYPPEFIDLKLFWNGGGLHGEYRARYEVTDKPISPDVSFVLSPTNKDSRKFVWQGSNGSRGTLKISAVDGSSIRIEWKTTVFSQGPALTAGTATLVRRSP